MSLVIPVGPNDHARGPADAPITLVVYADYECPVSGRAHPVVKAIVREFGNDLRFVFRHFPLTDLHPNAELAAEAAEAAGAQGRFWAMHDELFEHQRSLSQELVQTLVLRLELTSARFDEDMVLRNFRERVKQDFLGGVRSGVEGTPTFFINGERYNGTVEKAALSEALRGVLQTLK